MWWWWRGFQRQLRDRGGRWRCARPGGARPGGRPSLGGRGWHSRGQRSPRCCTHELYVVGGRQRSILRDWVLGRARAKRHTRAAATLKPTFLSHKTGTKPSHAPHPGASPGLKGDAPIWPRRSSHVRQSLGIDPRVSPPCPWSAGAHCRTSGWSCAYPATASRAATAATWPP